METKDLSEGLTAKQKLFCELYVSKEFFGNGTQSYIEAYNVDLSVAGAYVVAKTEAYTNLTKPHLLNYINSMLDDAGLNDAFVDKQILLVITQNADFSSKVAAIKEYNKLKGRITGKVKVTTTNYNIDLSKDEIKSINDGLESKY